MEIAKKIFCWALVIGGSIAIIGLSQDKKLAGLVVSLVWFIQLQEFFLKTGRYDWFLREFGLVCSSSLLCLTSGWFNPYVAALYAATIISIVLAVGHYALHVKPKIQAL